MWGVFIDQSTEVAKVALLKLGSILSTLIGLLVVIVVGWLIAKVVKAVTLRVLKTAKFDSVSDSTGISDFLKKGGIKHTLSEVIGNLFYWLCLLVTAAVAVDFLGLAAVAELLNRVILYVPHIIVAIFVLLLGVFMSKFLGTLVQTTAANAGLMRAKLLSKIVEVIVIISAVVIALEQLNIGADIITFLVKYIIISIAAAAALAFGLGCKDMAAKALAGWLEKIQEKK